MHSWKSFAGCLILVLLSMLPASAFAYKQTMTCTPYGAYACNAGEVPKPVHWPKTCVSYRINDAGTTNADVPAGLNDDLVTAITWSFDQWNQVDCSAMQMSYDGPTSNSAAEFNTGSGAKNINLVVFRDTTWDSVASPQTFALTSVTFNPKTGIIGDADIEINSQYFPISVVDPPESDHVDLRNTLVHEVGHFIGLDHVDNPNSTMYYAADVGDTDKRSLAQDDIDGICHIYPTGGSLTCHGTSNGGDAGNGSSASTSNGACCATTNAPAPSSLVWLAGAFGLIGLAGARRRAG